MRQLLISLLLLAIAPACFAQSLWRDLPAGATVDQVRKLLPESEVPDEPSQLVGGRLGQVEQRGFKLGGLDFKATMYFKDGMLERIFLRPIEDPTGPVARSAANSIREGLTAKYGDNGKVTDRRRSGVTTQWARDGVLIMLMFDQYGDDGAGFIQVNYVAPAGLDNL